MGDVVHVAAFEGGSLRVLAGGGKPREAVLALPLNRLIVKVLCLADDAAKEDPVAFASPILQAMSPYPDEPLAVSCETVRDTPRGRVVIAAALPESATDDVADQLDGQKINVTRVDAFALGALRGLWPTLGVSDGARRAVLMTGPDALELVVLDGEGPSVMRALSSAGDVKREIMLSLLEAEDFGGPMPLREIVIVDRDGEAAEPAAAEDEDGAAASGVRLGAEDEAALAAFAPVRRVTVGADAGLVGVAERSADPGALNAIPDSWREVLAETRFKAKMVRWIAAASVVWALVAAVIFGVPFGYGYMTDRQKQLSKEHRRKFEEVENMRKKVELVKKYSDHTRGALEFMKAVSDRLPGDVTLDSYAFKRGSEEEKDGGVHVAGVAEGKESVYALKDAMTALGTEKVTDEEGEETVEGERIFGKVSLSGPTAGKGGQKFDLDCRCEKEENE